MSPISISAVILTRNEEARVRDCLRALTGWVDQVVVVDDCSTDRTISICESYRAEAIVHASLDDYGGQRNLGLEAARSTWILSLDADEVVTESLRAEIIARVSEPNAPSAFRIRRLNHLFGKALRHTDDGSRVALFRKVVGRYSSGVHEHLIVDIPAIPTLKNRILHYPYPTIASLIEKQNRYTSLEIRQRRDPAEARLRDLLVVPTRRFFAVFFRRHSILDGIPGFAWATFAAIYAFMAAAKRYESGVGSSVLAADRGGKDDGS